MAASARCLLLVDDDPRNLLALEAILGRQGHRLISAMNGPKALELFEREKPDIVLCDLMMPEMDGIEVLARIRAHRERWDTPVIMVTAYVEREHRSRALAAGVDEFIEKPIDGTILLARIATLLRLKRSRDDLVAQHATLQRLQAEQRRLLEFIVRDMAEPASVLARSIDAIHIGEAGADLATTVDEMRTAMHQLSAMVEDLAWVARVETGSAPLAGTMVSVDAIVARVADRFTHRAKEREITLEVVGPEQVVLLADERAIERVVENLLDNALRHARSGGRVAIELRRHDGAELRVSNDGAAIPADERERIFEKFARGTTELPSAGRPGLGLYFCKRVVDAHHGEIAVIEAPEWATCFRVWLPTSSGRG